MGSIKWSVCLAVAVTLISGQAWAQQLRIDHIDVDQGDSTLFVAPAGNTLLVDSGRNGHGSRIQNVMATASVTDIDFYVTTHYHADHYGGIDELVDAGVTVLEAYDRGDKQFLPASKTTQATFQDYQRTVGEDAIQLRREMTIPLDPMMTVTAVSYGGVVIGEQNPMTAEDENDMSVSLLVTFGAFRYFVGGDIETPTEEKIAARDLVTDVDVYQANHHGSDTSSSVNFLNDLSPTVVVVSNGDRADYQHPRQLILDRFAAMNPAPTVFQTNRYTRGGDGGNVADAFIADPDTAGEDGTILVTVNAATNSYAVTYGTQSHSFAVKASGPAPTTSVVIASLLPNPVGIDADLETVTLRNTGSDAVSLVGWRLRDRNDGEWDLTALGTLGPGQSTTVRRNGTMSLNNAGDEITLLDAGHGTVDVFEYDGSSEGVAIQTGH